MHLLRELFLRDKALAQRVANDFDLNRFLLVNLLGAEGGEAEEVMRFV
jgi:hypothetical protein